MKVREWPWGEAEETMCPTTSQWEIMADAIQMLPIIPEPLPPVSLAFEAALWVQWIWRASWASSGEWEMGHTPPLQWPFILFPCSKTLNPNHIQSEMLSYINPEWQRYFRQSPGLKCLMSRLNVSLFFSLFQPSERPSSQEDFLWLTDPGSIAWENMTRPWTSGEGRTLVSYYYAWEHLSDGT